MGTHLAKFLANENQDIIVIDRDESKLSKLEAYNMLTYVAIRYRSNLLRMLVQKTVTCS